MNADKDKAVWPFPSSGAPAHTAGDVDQQEQGEAQEQRPSSDPNESQEVVSE